MPKKKQKKRSMARRLVEDLQANLQEEEETRLKRVRAALSSHVALSETRTSKAVAFAHRDEWWGVLFGDGTWTGRGRYGNDNLNGYIGGFSSAAPDLAWIAVDLKLITEAEAETFGRWFRAEREREEKASELAKARRVAERYGYTFTQLPSRKSRATPARKKTRRRR